jgi:hypothetical protein
MRNFHGHRPDTRAAARRLADGSQQPRALAFQARGARLALDQVAIIDVDAAPESIWFVST